MLATGKAAVRLGGAQVRRVSAGNLGSSSAVVGRNLLRLVVCVLGSALVGAGGLVVAAGQELVPLRAGERAAGD
jgi:hypothetical protein